VLLWLWCRLAATARIRPLAWEPPYATGAALKRQNKNKVPVELGLPKPMGLSMLVINLGLETEKKLNVLPSKTICEISTVPKHACYIK